MSRYEENARGCRFQSGGKQIDRCHATPPCVTTPTSVSTQAQRRHASLANVGAVYQRHEQAHARSTQGSSDTINDAVREHVTPFVRRHSDSAYLSRKSSLSRHQGSLPSSPPKPQKQSEKQKEVVLTSGGLTGVLSTGTGDADSTIIEQSAHPPVQGWEEMEQQWPRFRLAPLDTTKCMHYSQREDIHQRCRQTSGNRVWDRSIGTGYDSEVKQLPRLCDPAARILSKSVRDFSRLVGHPGTFIH